MFALKNAVLIDGTGKEPIPQCTILMEHGKFKKIGTDIPVPSGAMVMDLQGKTVIPRCACSYQWVKQTGPSRNEPSGTKL